MMSIISASFIGNVKNMTEQEIKFIFYGPTDLHDKERTIKGDLV